MMTSQKTFDPLRMNSVDPLASEPSELSSFRCFDGYMKKFVHKSTLCQIDMTFSLFIPDHPQGHPIPTLLFLGGMTCSDDSFLQQGGALRRASQLGLMIACPDTSPRGTGIAGEDESFDLGSGASFYVDATTPKWSKHYQMYSYVMDEFLSLITSKFSADGTRISISGHSMGGNAALFMSLQNPGRFLSCSAFAPVCNPSQNKWGHKVFSEYLGDDRSAWSRYDAVSALESLQGQISLPILIDQGDKDFFSFPEDALTPRSFVDRVSPHSEFNLTFHLREGYDHFFCFIQTFVDSHLDFHAGHLGINK